MNLGRILSPRAINVSSKLSSSTESSFAQTEEFNESKPQAGNQVDQCSVVERRFMSMMETHDRMRARVLGLSSPGSHAISND